MIALKKNIQAKFIDASPFLAALLLDVISEKILQDTSKNNLLGIRTI